jgi:DNA modification methylase
MGAFWTSGQRQAANLHEVSYRACFKPQLPAYFIKRFSAPGDCIYDPFSGRGTTAIEAALWGRNIVANDVNPLSALLVKPRLFVPCLIEVAERLRCIPLDYNLRADIDLSMFYHPATEAELVSLKHYLRARHESGTEDMLDGWIRMVATNRLTGHSPGFFSVYTFPPNQAVSQASQVRINVKRDQVPSYRDTKAIILKKSRQLLQGLTSEQIEQLHTAAQQALFLTGDARATPEIPDGSIQLTVTSPPFLNIVQYAEDNWLRCWFNSLPTDQMATQITMARTVERWSEVMGRVFTELFRVTKAGGFVAFEVGEVRNGKIKLEETVVPLGVAAGFRCEAILINAQQFTKTANIWGVVNNRSGTNSNRIVLLRK